MSSGATHATRYYCTVKEYNKESAFVYFTCVFSYTTKRKSFCRQIGILVFLAGAKPIEVNGLEIKHIVCLENIF